MSYYPDCISRCQHIKINGTQCGSPALRRNRFCYFHKRWRDQTIRLNRANARKRSATFELPLLEDANSIQVALMQVMRLLASGQLDHKTASLLLYALQTASSNMRHTSFEPSLETKVVINPKEVDQTPLGEDPWSPEQFEEEDEEEEDEEEDGNESGVEIQAVAGEQLPTPRVQNAREIPRPQQWPTEKVWVPARLPCRAFRSGDWRCRRS